MISNAVFARYTAWMEAFSDNRNFNLHGFKKTDKHSVYTVVRGCLWATYCYLLGQQCKDWWEFICCDTLMILAVLLEFRFIHDGYYHLFRNDFNKLVSSERFFQDGDMFSSSVVDKILGHTFRARLVCFYLCFAMYALLVLFILNNR